MRIDLLAHLIGVHAFAINNCRAVGMQQRCIDVLMVQHQQTVVTLSAFEARIHGKEMHAVVVHACLLGLIFRTVAGVFEECWIASTDRRAPRDKGFRGEASGYRNGVGSGHGHRPEGETVTPLKGRPAADPSRLGCSGHRRQPAEKGQRAERRAAGHNLAAPRIDDILDVRVG